MTPPIPAYVPNLRAVASAARGRGPAWTLETDDLDVNLLAFGSEEGVQEHVNREVDVLLVGVAGEGTITIDGASHPLAAGALLLIPKGTRRAIRATSERFVYLSCHRRRRKLSPEVR